MPIDVGDVPVGTPPTVDQQLQIRNSIGLGTAATVDTDTNIINGSANAVTSNAVFDALASKAPLISPSFTTPSLGTPTSGNLVNCTFPTLNQSTTGNAATVTTNANLTGHVTSIGNSVSLGSFTLAQLSTAVTDANIARTDAAQTLNGLQSVVGGISITSGDLSTFGAGSVNVYGSGTISTGTGNIASGGTITAATPIAITSGGTGGNTASAARTNLKVPASDITGITGAGNITNIVTLAPVDYATLVAGSATNATTLYIITE